MNSAIARALSRRLVSILITIVVLYRQVVVIQTAVKEAEFSSNIFRVVQR